MPAVAVAVIVWSPGASVPRTRKVILRVPAESSITVRDDESTLSPRGSESETRSGWRDIIADLSVTLMNLSIREFARASSTA